MAVTACSRGALAASPSRTGDAMPEYAGGCPCGPPPWDHVAMVAGFLAGWLLGLVTLPRRPRRRTEVCPLLGEVCPVEEECDAAA